MAEPERADDSTGTENGEAMRPDPMHPDPMHPDPMHPDPTHTDPTGTTVPPVARGPRHTDVVTTDVITTGDPAAPARRRGPDPLALLVGLATLAMAVFAFVGELPDLSGLDARWLLAGGAAVIGLVLLVGNLRNRSGGRRSGS